MYLNHSFYRILEWISHRKSYKSDEKRIFMMDITEIKDLTKDNDHILAIFYNDRNIKLKFINI